MILVVAPGDAVNVTDDASAELLDIAQAFLDDPVDLVQNDVQIAVHDDVTHRLGLAQALAKALEMTPASAKTAIMSRRSFGFLRAMAAMMWLPKHTS